MAKQFQNEKGFMIIEMSPKEAKSIGFGLPEGCVCMHCNKIIEDKIYYIAALNDVMDKKCLDDWYEDAIRYKEDISYELRYFDRIMQLLNNGRVTEED